MTMMKFSLSADGDTLAVSYGLGSGAISQTVAFDRDELRILLEAAQPILRVLTPSPIITTVRQKIHALLEVGL